MSDRPSSRDADDEELGSLAQSARKSSLKQARVILVLVGILTLVVNLVLVFLAEQMVEQAIKDEQRKAGPGMVFVVNEQEKAKAVRITQMVSAGSAALGGLFILLGIMVYAAPVACTVTGLVLYVAGIAVFAVMNPEGIAQGFIIKILIIIGLVKAVQAATAYEREARAEKRSRSRREYGEEFEG